MYPFLKKRASSFEKACMLKKYPLSCPATPYKVAPDRIEGIFLALRVYRSEQVYLSKGGNLRTGGDFRCFHLDVAGFYRLLEMMVAFGRVVD